MVAPPVSSYDGGFGLVRLDVDRSLFGSGRISSNDTGTTALETVGLLTSLLTADPLVTGTSSVMERETKSVAECDPLSVEMWLSTSASTELGAGVVQTTMSVSVFDVEATSTGDSTIVVLVNDVGVFLEVDVF